MAEVKDLIESAKKISEQANDLAGNLSEITVQTATTTAVHGGAVDPFIFGVAVFILACFVGYYVVWSVTPALHTPLMSVTNAISGIIVVGAIIAVGPEIMGISTWFGFIAVIIASVNIFGGFVVTQRMLQNV